MGRDAARRQHVSRELCTCLRTCVWTMSMMVSLSPSSGGKSKVPHFETRVTSVCKPNLQSVFLYGCKREDLIYCVGNIQEPQLKAVCCLYMLFCTFLLLCEPICTWSRGAPMDSVVFTALLPSSHPLEFGDCICMTDQLLLSGSHSSNRTFLSIPARRGGS